MNKQLKKSMKLENIVFVPALHLWVVETEICKVCIILKKSNQIYRINDCFSATIKIIRKMMRNSQFFERKQTSHVLIMNRLEYSVLFFYLGWLGEKKIKKLLYLIAGSMWVLTIYLFSYFLCLENSSIILICIIIIVFKKWNINLFHCNITWNFFLTITTFFFFFFYPFANCQRISGNWDVLTE